MSDTVTIQCPWCFQWVEIFIDPQTRGRLVRDCEVCCRPWELTVTRDDTGQPRVVVQRSN